MVDNETGVVNNETGVAGNKAFETGVVNNETGVASKEVFETGVVIKEAGVVCKEDFKTGVVEIKTGVVSNKIGLAAKEYTIKLQLTLKRPTVLQCLRRARPWRYSQNATIFRELALTMPCATFRMSLCQCRPSRACCKAVKTFGSIVEQTS